MLVDSCTISFQKIFPKIRDFFFVGVGGVLMAFSAPFSILLPFTPIPIALAPHFALAMGALLGKTRGSCAVALYLFQGLVGVPVFALHAFGFPHLLGPRGGYLIGYLVAAYVVGFLMESKGEKTTFKLFFSLMIGNAVIYLFGLAQLSGFIGLGRAVVLGIVPFLFGDAVKLILLFLGIRQFIIIPKRAENLVFDLAKDSGLDDRNLPE